MITFSNQPLRRKMVALLLVGVGAALLLAGLAATTALSNYLERQQVNGLHATANQVSGRVGAAIGGPGGTGGPGGSGGSGGAARPDRPDRRDGRDGPAAYYVRISNAEGTEHEVRGTPAFGADHPPALPNLTVQQVAAMGGKPFTVPSAGGGPDWQVVAEPMAGEAGSVMVSQSLGPIEATVGRLAMLQLLIGAVTLVVLGFAGRWLVRRELRPLEEVEATADRIAGGDLTLRVPQQDPGTEVGRLAQSLNTMLGQIQAGFTAQRASASQALAAEAQAKASEARMREFVGDASHELRTPLTSIRGFSELYRQGAVQTPEQTADVMARIEAEAQRMGLLVDDLLLLARLDAERPLDLVEVSLDAVAEEAAASARAASGRRIEVALAGEGRWDAFGDRARLHQVLGNLLSNAIRYSPADQPITVRLDREERKGDIGARIDVIDHGTGMEPEVAEHVFERFYRGDAARARTDGGAGLGLSIVAAIVTAHGGEADVQSKPGEGSTFSVWIPLL